MEDTTNALINEGIEYLKEEKNVLPKFSVFKCIKIGFSAGRQNRGIVISITLLFLLLSILIIGLTVGGSKIIVDKTMAYLYTPNYYLFFILMSINIIMFGTILLTLVAGYSYLGVRFADTQLYNIPLPTISDLFADLFANIRVSIMKLICASFIMTVVCVMMFSPLLFLLFLFFRSPGGGVEAMIEVLPLIFLLLLVMGILLSICFMFRFLFVFPLIIDKKLGVIEAFKTSWNITKDYALPLLSYVIKKGRTYDGIRWLGILSLLLIIILVAGIIVLGISIFFTFPIAVTSLGAAYRMLSEK